MTRMGCSGSADSGEFWSVNFASMNCRPFLLGEEAGDFLPRWSASTLRFRLVCAGCSMKEQTVSIISFGYAEQREKERKIEGMSISRVKDMFSIHEQWPCF